MLYTPSHAELAQHPKVKRLARKLGVSIPTALGHLHLLWHFALKYAQDGDLARFDPDDLAEGCLWEGDAATLIDALAAAGWLDRAERALNVHDWHEHGGKYVQRKEANAARMRDQRAANKLSTSGERAENVQRTRNARTAHAEDVQRTSGERVEPEERRGEESKESNTDTNVSGTLRDRWIARYKNAGNKNGIVGECFSDLLGAEPNYARLGAMTKRLNSGGKLIGLIFDASKESIADDPHDYLERLVSKSLSGGDKPIRFPTQADHNRAGRGLVL